MKKLYRKTIERSEDLFSNVEVFKTWGYEWVEIIRKQKLYKDIRWSKKEKEEFDNYWEKTYGKRISPKWHKLYQKTNGEFNIKYIPEIIYTTKIEPKMNKLSFSKILQDKALVEILYSERVKTPKTYVVNSSGINYDCKRNIISDEQVKEILSNAGSVVIKPTLGGSSGHGVKKLSLAQGVDRITKSSLDKILKSYNKDYIVQQTIVPHQTYAALHPSSINTVRVITYTVDGRVYHAPTSFRMGTGNSTVDNIHSGGIVIYVSEKGELHEYGYKLGYGDSTIKFKEHPDTKFIFKDYRLPKIQEILQKSEELHGLTPHIGIISWDFTLDSNEEILLIETNLKGQSVWFPQMVSGKSFFGDNTEKILELL